MKPIALSLLAFVLIILWEPARAQIYPVEVMPMVAPPYPAYLADYAREDLTIQRMQVNILMRDLSQAHRRVRLKVYIDGPGLNVSGSDMPNNVEPLFLDGGATLRLTNAQLAPYFRVENLLGMSPQVYARPLFSGLYTFGFEVYDFATGNRLSARRNAPLQIVYNLPPLLNLPATGSELSSAFPQNVMFNWTPRHSDISNTEYEFTLVELNYPMLQGEAAFAVYTPFYQQTTMATALVYGPAMPPLAQGKRYAWRVQVKSRMGAAYTPVFEHDGYSPVYTFTCESSTPAPVNLTATPRERYTALATWKGQPEHTSYMIELRQKPGQEGGSSNWYQYTVTDTQYLFQNLRPGYAYECRVTGYRNQHNYATSETVEFATPAMNPPKFEGCGTTAPKETITNRTPLEHLLVGDVFTAAGSPVTVVAVEEASGEAFSGTGWVKLPFLGDNKIKVKFTDIQINTDYQLIAGTVETTYDPKHGNIIDVNQVAKQLAEDLVTTFSELANAVSNRIEKFIASFEKEGVTQTRLDSLNTIVPKNIDKLIASAPAETKGLMEQAKQTYDEYYACLNEQAKSSTPEPQPANNAKGPNPYGYMEMTGETRNCAEKGKQAVALINQANAKSSSGLQCGCTLSDTTTDDCKTIKTFLVDLKLAYDKNTDISTKKLPVLTSNIRLGNACFNNVTLDMGQLTAGNVTFCPSSYSIKWEMYNLFSIHFDKILDIELLDDDGTGFDRIHALENYLFNGVKKDVSLFTTSEIGKKMLRIFEGCAKTAPKAQQKGGFLYEDDKGYCTFGIGHLVRQGNCTAGDITEYSTKTWSDVLSDFDQTLVTYESYVKQEVKEPVSQTEFDAMVSFCFNVGIGNGDEDSKRAGFSGSKFLKNLNNQKPDGNLMLNFPDNPARRAAEVNLFNTGKYTYNNNDITNLKIACDGN